MYTNHGNISFILATWLAADDGYDLIYHPNVFSATEILNPVRSVILSRLVLEQNQQGNIDVMDLVPSRLGQAVHTAIEEAWISAREKAFENLNIPQHIRDRIKLNPSNEDDPNAIYIYMERRSSKVIDGVQLSGRLDIVEQGRVKDIKTTKTYNWIKGTNDKKYQLQGSIYRWLNPDIITDDFMDVEMIFTDWSMYKAKADKAYPQQRIMTRTLPLLDMGDTENFIRQTLAKLKKYEGVKQEDLPRCTPEELWMDPPKWAYYRKRENTTRATKLYDNENDAFIQCRADGNTGMVVKRESEPTFCKFCNARPICLQAEEYINSGLLQL